MTMMALSTFWVGLLQWVVRGLRAGLFVDALALANLSVETLAEGVVDTSRLPTREFSFFIPH